MQTKPKTLLGSFASYGTAELPSRQQRREEILRQPFPLREAKGWEITVYFADANIAANRRAAVPLFHGEYGITYDRKVGSGFWYEEPVVLIPPTRPFQGWTFARDPANFDVI